VLALVAVF
jgi:putative integral membrane protein (TIGR02587 family)